MQFQNGNLLSAQRMRHAGRVRHVARAAVVHDPRPGVRELLNRFDGFRRNTAHDALRDVRYRGHHRPLRLRLGYGFAENGLQP